MNEKAQFTIEIRPKAGGDIAAADTAALALAQELRSLPHLEVDRATGAPPRPGEKSVAAITNDLLVQIAGGAVTLALPALVTSVRGWMGMQDKLSCNISFKCGEAQVELAEGTPVDEVVKLMVEASKGAAA